MDHMYTVCVADFVKALDKSIRRYQFEDQTACCNNIYEIN